SYKSHKDSGFKENPFADAEREFQRGQLLNHPNIIKSFELFLYTSCCDEVTHNLILELVEGKTLHNSKNKELQLDQSLNATLQLIQALRYALSLGFVNVDLHGGNVMLNQNM